jgi:Protein of unknown function (DUF4236)
VGFSYRRSFGIGKGTRFNLSTRGVSVSKRVGRVTLNSRGGFAVRLLKGLSYRGGRR